MFSRLKLTQTSNFLSTEGKKTFLLLLQCRSCRVPRSRSHCSAGLCRWWPNPSCDKDHRSGQKSVFHPLQLSPTDPTHPQTLQIWIQILPDLQMEFRPCRMTPVNRVRWMASTSSHWCWSRYMAHQAPSYISPSSMPDWKHMLHRRRWWCLTTEMIPSFCFSGWLVFHPDPH